jgi:hypothetical protein
MGKWTEMLLNRASIKTDPSGNTVKTVKTSQGIPDDVQKLQQSDSFDGFDGNLYGACFENTPHAETIVERAAIMEHDSELPRDRANRLASESYDRGGSSMKGPIRTVIRGCRRTLPKLYPTLETN